MIVRKQTSLGACSELLVMILWILETVSADLMGA
jgi:hypothetical protein